MWRMHMVHGSAEVGPSWTDISYTKENMSPNENATKAVEVVNDRATKSVEVVNDRATSNHIPNRIFQHNRVQIADISVKTNRRGKIASNS